MILEIEAQGIHVDPCWREMIDDGLKKLKRFSDEETRVRITLVASRHHLLGDNEVRLAIHLPNAEIIMHKKAAQMGDAIRSAFRAGDRALKDYAQRRHHPYQIAHSRITRAKTTTPSTGLSFSSGTGLAGFMQDY